MPDILLAICKFRSIHLDVLCKNSSSEKFGKLSGKSLRRSPTLIKVESKGLQLYQNSTPSKVYVWKYFDIFRTAEFSRT